MMGKENILKARWSKKDNDILICYPDKRDGAFLHWQFGKHPESLLKPFELSKSFFDELKARGYDLTTFNFSIKKAASK